MRVGRKGADVGAVLHAGMRSCRLGYLHGCSSSGLVPEHGLQQCDDGPGGAVQRAAPGGDKGNFFTVPLCARLPAGRLGQCFVAASTEERR